jgi:hypothetical protein
MKKVLIISNGYPGFGGQSTTAHHLGSLLNKNNIKCKVFFLNEVKMIKDVDTKTIINSDEIIIKRNLLKGGLRSFVQAILKNKVSIKLGITFLSSILYRQIKAKLVVKKIKNFLNETEFYPNLVITNSPKMYDKISKIFHNTIIIIGSSSIISNHFKKKIDYITISKNKEYLQIKNKKSHQKYLLDNYIIFNSPLTFNLYKKLGFQMPRANVQFFNFFPFSATDILFKSRKYDLGVVVSWFSRKVKNPEKINKLFKLLPNVIKVAIGKGSNNFENIENIEKYDLVSQKELSKILSNTKLIIIPSLFDSSPSILSEAILNGCNVLISKNVGWHEMIEKDCVIENFFDDNEWIKKINILVKNKIQNSVFKNHIQNSQTEITNLIKQQLNKF